MSIIFWCLLIVTLLLLGSPLWWVLMAFVFLMFFPCGEEDDPL